MDKKKIQENKEKDIYCFRCGSYEVELKKDGSRVCQSKYCGAISKLTGNELNIKFILGDERSEL